MTAPRKGEHGEPWQVPPEPTGVKFVEMPMDRFRRASICVNVLSGRDPAQVGRLLKAVDTWNEKRAAMVGDNVTEVAIAQRDLKRAAREMGAGDDS